MKLRKFITTTLNDYISETNNHFKKDNLEKLYHNTYRYNGVIDTYHLSTRPDLKLDGDFKSERGGGGDYIYSSLEYEKWLEIFDQENLGETPKHLYVLRLKNPKYKPGFSLFNRYTPSEFLSTKDNTEIIKYLGEV